MDRNEKEKNMLLEWAERNNEVYQFTRIAKEKKSYFIERQEEPYIREYGFETLPELFHEMDCMWKNEQYMEEIRKVIGVAALKNKPSEDMHGQEEINPTADKEDILPEFIYNF